MRFSVILFGLLGFIGTSVLILAVFPAQSASLAYLVLAGIFAWNLKVQYFGNSLPSSISNEGKGKLARRWAIACQVIFIAGGVAAFVAYWVTENHVIAIETCTVFIFLAMLTAIAGGGRFH